VYLIGKINRRSFGAIPDYKMVNVPLHKKKSLPVISVKMHLLSLLPLLTLASYTIATNTTCPTFIAKNSTSQTYRINFYDNGLNSDYQAPPTLPANISANNPAKLEAAGNHGAHFTITNCSSSTQSSCSHGSSCDLIISSCK